MRKPVPLIDLVELLDLTEESRGLAKRNSLYIHDIQNADTASAESIVFLSHEKHCGGLRDTQAKVFVTNENILAKISPELLRDKLCLISKNVQIAFAKTSSLFQVEENSAAEIHPSAVIHKTARLGKNVSIGPHCVVDAETNLGDNVVLYSGVKIGKNVQIGKNSILFYNVVIYDCSKLGSDVRIHANTVIGGDGFGYVQETQGHSVKHIKIHHMGKVIIGNDVEIGCSTTIDRGTVGNTVIGDHCKIDNQVQIGHNCHLDEGVIVCGCTGIAGSAKIGKYTFIGGMVGVGDHAVVGSGVMIAAQSGVTTGHYPDRTIWYGNPPRQKAEYFKLQALYSKLPEMHEATKKGKKKNGESHEL